jgi:putative transposase
MPKLSHFWKFSEGVILGTLEQEQAQDLLSRPPCKFCGSHNVVKNGHRKSTQYWLCRACNRGFVANNALVRGKFSTDEVSDAVGMYFRGMSLNEIGDQLNQQYSYKPNESTIWRWILRHSEVAVKEADKCIPDVGDEWVADETVLNVVGGGTKWRGKGGKGNKYWLLDVIDAKTRYLLATRLSTTRNISDIEKLMLDASKRAGGIIPKRITADGLRAYDDGIERAFGSDTKRILGNPFDTENSTNLIERWHGTLKDRTKVMRGLKSLATAKKILAGWLTYYNLFRAHESLDDKTPAQTAGIKFQFKGWDDVVRSQLPEHTIPKEPDYPFKSMNAKAKRINRQVRRVALKAKRLKREQRGGHGTTRDDGGIMGII